MVPAEAGASWLGGSIFTQTWAAFLDLAGGNMGPLVPQEGILLPGRGLVCGCEDAFDPSKATALSCAVTW